MAKSRNERAAEVIDVAIDVLNATGWCRMHLGDWEIEQPGEDGAHCTLGCLAAGAYILGLGLGDDPYCPTPGSIYAKVVEEVNDSLPAPWLDYIASPLPRDQKLTARAWQIAMYNDALGEGDKEKVLALFRRVAEKLRAA